MWRPRMDHQRDLIGDRKETCIASCGNFNVLFEEQQILLPCAVSVGSSTGLLCVRGLAAQHPETSAGPTLKLDSFHLEV